MSKCPHCGESLKVTKEQWSEHVRAGIERARRNGKTIGRPKIVDVRRVLKMWGDGKTVKQIAKELRVSIRSIQVAVKNETNR